jgi:hypothetical protein
MSAGSRGSDRGPGDAPVAVPVLELVPAAPVPPHERNKHGAPKATAQQRKGKATDRARLDEVISLRELLFDDRSIVDQVSKRFGVSKRTVRSDIVRVKAAWLQERKERTVEESVARAERTAMRMFRRSVAKGDDKTARKWFQDYCRIVGAYAPDAVKLEGFERERIAGMTDEELDAAIVAAATAAGKRVALNASPKEDS